MSCIILDLEATGLHPEKGDTIIDVAIIRVGKGGIEERFQSLVHPGNVEVTPFIQALTGISAEMLVGAPKLSDVLEQVRAFIGDDLPIVGHNISFDCQFLRVLGLSINPEREVDTCDFATLYFPHAPSHSLEVLSTYLSLPHGEKHRAMGDVLATYALLEALVAMRNSATDEMLHAAQEVLRKAPGWAGRHFFALEMPAQMPVLALDSRIAVLTQDVPRQNGIYQYVLQPSIERSLQWSLAQGDSAAILVPPSDVDSYRDRIHADKRGFFFDSPHQFLAPAPVEAFLQKEHWSADEALFALRLLMLAPRHAYVHVASLSVTHRERTMVGMYTATDEDAPAILADAENAPLFVTYYAWHSYKELITNRTWIIPDAMRMELYLHQTAKKYLSQDMLQNKVKAFAARCDVKNIETQDLVESLEFLLRYAFSGLAKLMKSDEKEYVLHEAPDVLISFQLAWQKGFVQWRERIMTLDDSAKQELLRQCDVLAEAIAAFTAGIADNRKYTSIARMNQGILLQQELTDLHQEKVWFEQQSACQMLLGYTDASFPLFLEAQGQTPVDTFPAENCIFEEQRSRHLLKMTAPDDVVSGILEHQSFRSLLYCTGSGTNVDRAFEPIYDAFHNASCSVLSSGKTGGRGKVRFNFMHAERSILISTPQEAKGLGVSADALLLASLPFPAVMSKYWQVKYGENNFGLLTMPLLAQQMVDTLWGAWSGKSDEQVHLYVVDTRFFEKRYGQETAEVLKRMMHER